MASVNVITEQCHEDLVYVEVTLCGVPCLELLSALSKDSAKAKLLKNQKDQLSRSHPVVPLLEYKTGENGSKAIKYIIVYTDNVK